MGDDVEPDAQRPAEGADDVEPITLEELLIDEWVIESFAPDHANHRDDSPDEDGIRGEGDADDPDPGEPDEPYRPAHARSEPVEHRPPTLGRRALVGGLVAIPVVAAAGGIYKALKASSPETAEASEPAGASGDTPSASNPVDGSGEPGPTAPPAKWDVVSENAKPGTSDWQITQDRPRWEKVRGYVSRTSAAQGEKIALFASTAGKSFTATAFRMGHYNGKGGRQVWSSGPLPGKRQAPASNNPVTGMRGANWEPNVTFTIDDTWVPGAYLFKLVSDDGGESQIPFVVRDDARPSAVHIQHDVTTWQAYNKWGGASLYEGVGGRAKVVTFDRPYDLSGSGNFLGGVFEITALVESLGLDVTHSTNLDTHLRPDLVKHHKVWISPAHDEYWSLEMRNGVEAARDSGVNLMFLGANAMYRRIRLEDTFIGKARNMVNYRVAKDDPLNGKDPERVTTSWRDAPAARPESSIVGVFYESNPVKADMVIADADAWMFQGTGVKNGDKWANVVGNEYDRVTLEVATPPTIQVLAHSPVVCKGKKSFADMAYYTTDSGAGVFSTGSIWFERHLSPGGTGTDGQMVAMMTNILKVFAQGPAGNVHPSKPNLDKLGIKKGYIPRIA